MSGQPEVRYRGLGGFFSRVLTIRVRSWKEKASWRKAFALKGVQVTESFYERATGTNAETVTTPTGVDYIAPTLSKAMRIRAPNACLATPLSGF